MQINVTFASFDEIDEFVTVWARGRIAQATVNVSNVVTRGTDTRPVTAEVRSSRLTSRRTRRKRPACALVRRRAPTRYPRPRRSASAARRRRLRLTRLRLQRRRPSADLGTTAGQSQVGTRAAGRRPDRRARQTDIPADIVALAGTIDGTDKLAHMNEGRDFISKHGFPKYNETFALADVPANIAAHTPEQAALHRAAMQWLGAQGGAK